MLGNKKRRIFWDIAVLSLFISIGIAHAQEDDFKKSIYRMGILKPRDSVSTLKVGDKAPNFSLTSVGGLSIPLSYYLKKKNVVISFVPAAWTPVCSAQWPEYNNAKDLFDDNDAILLGITVDNAPTLYSWMKNMCGLDGTLWFPVFSDFFPHGEVAKKYGVLRSEGFSERALFVIDKKGIIRFINVHDINKKPPLSELRKALEDLKE
ncbi:MAG: redoxin domain-containing protein [Deltaproteobacteria bacterium]|nr:redoxin domain-containing protein [Deltaproteobacteria bacterium]